MCAACAIRQGCSHRLIFVALNSDPREPSWLTKVHLVEGELVCPETGRKFPVRQGVPNMLLHEDGGCCVCMCVYVE